MRELDATYWLILLLTALIFLYRMFRRQIWRLLGWKRREKTALIRRRKFFRMSLGGSLAQAVAVYLVLLGLFIAEMWAAE